MPDMTEEIIAAAKRRRTTPIGIKLIGAMADLVPRHQLAEVTAIFRAPYANTFGATETGLPPASAGRIAIGVAPASLSKTPNSSCLIQLVDSDDNDVPEGTPGKLVMRGPTLFSAIRMHRKQTPPTSAAVGSIWVTCPCVMPTGQSTSSTVSNT
jgi:fatty-acyl-CoA synthase